MKLTDFLIDIGNSVAYYPKLVEVTGGVLPNLFFVTVGIESGNLQHYFTNNTKASNVWFKNSSGTWGRIPFMSKADNMLTTRPWSSIYAPTVTNSNGQVVTPDTINFKNQ